LFDPDLFRGSAIQHYLERESEGVPVPLRIAPAWTWWLFWVMSGSLFLAFILSVVIRVEVQGMGRGVFHVAGGARALVVQTSGRVTRVAATPGQRVARGDLLLELDSASVQSQLLEADQALILMERVTRPAQSGLDRLAEAQIKEALRRRDSQKEQQASQEESVHFFERKLAASEELGRYGLISAFGVEEAREALAQARRNVYSSRQTLTNAEQEIASLKARRDGDSLRNIQEYQALRTRRNSLAFALSQTLIVATESGIIEGLRVQVGDLVNAGQTVGRLLTDGESPRAFALLAERDRALVHLGDSVRLEVDQYPFADWGALKATIHRIGENPASLAELRELFGEDAKTEGSSYLVELTIPSGQPRTVAQQPLRSGMGFQARYTLRRQRPISFLFEPLRRWLE
jgi:multidrug resistance efflux pump